MNKLQISLDAQQTKALKIAQAFVWAQAAQLILDNIDKSALELRDMCLDNYHRGLLEGQ